MIRVAAWVLCAMLCLSCAEKKLETPPAATPRSSGNEPQFAPTTFVFDDQLAGKTLTVSDLSLRVPVGWEAVSDALFKKMQAAASQDTGQFRHQPVAAFSVNPSCRMIASTLPLAHPAREDFVWWARNLALVFRNVRTNAVIQESWMTLDGIRALVLYAKDSAMIQYKVILETQPPVALDFSFPVKFADLQEPKIKSSIASVKRAAATG